MYNDIKILAQGFQWKQNIIGNDFYKVSFLNTVNNGSLTYDVFTSQLDITNYIIKDSISELTFSLEDFFSNERNDKCFTASNFSFSVSDKAYNLKDFFGLVPTSTFNGDTTYIKYLIKLYYKNSLVWQGVLNPEMIEEEISTSKDSHIIKLTIIGIEKEFQDYYTNVKLSDIVFPSGFWTNQSPLYVYNKGGVTTIPRMANLREVLQIFFVKVNFNGLISTVNMGSIYPKYQNYTGDWIIFYDRHFTKYLSNPKARLKNVRNSFDSAIDRGETVWGFFSKLCNSMGWVFYFNHYKSGTTEIMELVVKNRYDTTSTLQSNIINVNNTNLLTPLTIKKKDNRIKYPFVILRDGAWSNLLTSNGNRCLVISNDTSIPIGTNFISKLIPAPIFPYTGNLYAYYGDEFVKLNSETNNEISFTSFTGVSTLNQNLWTQTKYNISDRNALIIDGGDSNNMYRFNIENGSNYYDGTTLGNAEDFDYSGNYGNMLGYFYPGETPIWSDLLYCYSDYVKGYHINRNIFVDNMRALLVGKNNVATDIVIKQVETNILKTVHFETGTAYYSDKNFSITELKIDFVNDMTYLNLINVDV